MLNIYKTRFWQYLKNLSIKLNPLLFSFIECCAISNENDSLSYQWGTQCGISNDELKYQINIIESKVPTETSCELKIAFIEEKGTSL